MKHLYRIIYLNFINFKLRHLIILNLQYNLIIYFKWDELVTAQNIYRLSILMVLYKIIHWIRTFTKNLYYLFIFDGFIIDHLIVKSICFNFYYNDRWLVSQYKDPLINMNEFYYWIYFFHKVTIFKWLFKLFTRVDINDIKLWMHYKRNFWWCCCTWMFKIRWTVKI